MQTEVEVAKKASVQQSSDHLHKKKFTQSILNIIKG